MFLYAWLAEIVWAASSLVVETGLTKTPSRARRTNSAWEGVPVETGSSTLWDLVLLRLPPQEVVEPGGWGKELGTLAVGDVDVLCMRLGSSILLSQ